MLQNYVAAGDDHSMFIDSDGFVWTCGRNIMGELGLGDTSRRLKPERIHNTPQIVSISAGSYHSLLLDVEGNVWSFGNNKSGQLGLGGTCNRHHPEQIRNLPKIQSMSAGASHSLFIDIEGSLWSCGANSSGQLGLKDRVERQQPEKILNLPKVRSVSAGFHHSLFIDVEGCVWSFGNNRSGQLGLEDGADRNKPEIIPNFGRIESVNAGWYHSLFLDTEGNVYACGVNNCGQLGLNDTLQRTSPEQIKNIAKIQSISAGAYHTMLVDVEGYAWCFGGNPTGQLGAGDISDRNQPHKLLNIPLVRSTSAGYNHSMFIDIEGFLWTCGQNNYGQLGLGDRVDRNQPETVPGVPRIKAEEKLAKLFLHQLEKREEIKEIFASLSAQSEPAPSLIEKIKLHSLDEKIKDVAFIKKKLLEGFIPLCGWTDKWLPNHNKHLEISESIENTKTLLAQLQQELLEIQNRIAHTQEQLQGLDEQVEAFQFFDGFMQPIAEVEKQLTDSFQLKLDNPKEFSTEDICLFLNYSGLHELVEVFEEKQITGEQLILLSSVDALSHIGIEDTLLLKKLEFYCKLLENGLLFKTEKLGQSVIWRHIAVVDTIKLLKEFNIALDENIIAEKRISICQLIFLKVEELKNLFSLNVLDAAKALQQLDTLKQGFRKFLKNK